LEKTSIFELLGLTTPDSLKKNDVTIPKECNLNKYLELIKDVPRPADEQVDNFIEHVFNAHSWYKHIPIYQPGIAFHFYIDPYAGYEVIFNRNKRVDIADISDEETFHYSWLPTDKYLSKFGHLMHASGGETMISQPYESNINYFFHERYIPFIFLDADNVFLMPDKVYKAGRIELTAAIHPRTQILWELMYSEKVPESLKRTIIGLSDSEKKKAWKEYFKSERNRLFNNTRTTITKMLDIIYNA